MRMELWQALFSLSHIKTQSPPLVVFLPFFSPHFLPLHPPPHPFLVAYAWQVVADVTRNDADGTHSHTEWKRS